FVPTATTVTMGERARQLAENIFISLIVLARNQAALRRDTLRRGRTRVFMSRKVLEQRYGRDAGSVDLQRRPLCPSWPTKCSFGEAHRPGEEPQHLLTLSEIRRSEAALSPTLPASFRKISCWGRPGRGHMLFRVGRTFAVVSCISVVAIEFAAAADIPY